MNWDHALSDSKALFLNLRVMSPKELPPKGRIFWGPDEWVGVEHHVTSLLGLRQGTGSQN